MMIGLIALWALLIWGAYYLATHAGRNEASHPRSALDLLEERYVRGEIDLAEFESRRRALQGL